jgi:hypothetical protein
LIRDAMETSASSPFWARIFAHLPILLIFWHLDSALNSDANRFR